MKTKVEIAHRHWDSRSQWTKKTEAHQHDIDLTTITDADVLVLQARLGITPPATGGGGTQPPVTLPPATGGPRVTSIETLLNAMADNNNSVVTLSAVTHQVATAASKAATSLWIGDRFAQRTKPLIVQWDPGAQGILDGGGATYFGGTTFTEGAHDIDWRIGRYDNGNPTETGVIVIGGYRGKAPVRNITLRGVAFLAGLWSHTALGHYNDHGIYLSYNAGGGHLIDGLTSVPNADPAKSLDTAVVMYHGDDYPTTDPNVDGLIIRHFDIHGIDEAIQIWDNTAKNIVLEDGSIDGLGSESPSTAMGVRYERGSNVTLRRVQTKNTVRGYYSDNGKVPVYDGCRFDAVTQQLVLV